MLAFNILASPFACFPPFLYPSIACCKLPVTATTRLDPQPSLSHLCPVQEKSRRKNKSVALSTPWVVRSCSKISCPCKGNIPRTGQDTDSEMWIANPKMGRREKQTDFVFPVLPQSDTMCSTVWLQVCVADYTTGLITCLFYSLKSIMQNYSAV